VEINVFSNLGAKVSLQLFTEVARTALQKALRLREVEPDLLFHTDRLLQNAIDPRLLSYLPQKQFQAYRPAAEDLPYIFIASNSGQVLRE